MSLDQYDPAKPNNFKDWVEPVSKPYEPPSKKKHTETTKIVVVLNMCKEYNDECEEDIKQEAKNFGSLADFTTHLDDNSEYPVQFYLKFNYDLAAEMFYRTVNGRFYDGKQLEAAFYPEFKFLQNRLGEIEH
ncbi:hypothetical protein SteCoe_19317 [Stentor coeruleus]|uniref:RRM domain-containing protein n=1 Tax=Stentor coeruleus TaxID=5963 RepID=A0A1R2BV13_9CILI|nr:hypothetical protein SteCoe_19317 [Stentor coeruleus]